MLLAFRRSPTPFTTVSLLVDSRDWQALLGGIDGREADVMVEGKEHALAPMGVEVV
jgi:hypothetical protein